MPEVKQGQVWRVRKTGKLRRVVALKNYGALYGEPYYDVSWETVDKPIRRGATYQDYFLRNCEFVAEASR
jgi:hypothetical protein